MTHRFKVILAIVGVASIIATLLLTTLTPYIACYLSIVLVFGMFAGCVGFVELSREEL